MSSWYLVQRKLGIFQYLQNISLHKVVEPAQSCWTGDLFRAGDISFPSGHPLVAWIEINCQCGGTEGMLCNVWWILMPTAVYWSTQVNRVSKYFSDVESTMSREKWISGINCRHQQPALQRFCELTDVLSSLKHGIALFAGLSVSSTPPYIVSRCFTPCVKYAIWIEIRMEICHNSDHHHHHSWTKGKSAKN